MTHVYRADLDETSKVVRTLVVHPDLAAEVRLLPVHADEQRLVGLELSVQGLDPKWRALDKPAPWKAGSVPVALTDQGTLVFCTLRDLRQERLRWLADHLSCAFQNDQDHSLLHKVATLEHADGVLGGHALTSGALLLLAEEHPGAPEIGA
ncbi:MAG: hypothetical protein GXP62_18640, partial [Oligoflexia bacterium]|nr:hypothetical protein [Oligoflexia bacterium]